MNTHRFLSEAVSKFFLVVLLVPLAFQSFGINGRAAPASLSNYLQQGADPQPLTCSCLSTNIQAVFLMDDSGSMRANDPQGRRNQLATKLVDRLATVQGDRALRLRDVQVAVIRFAGDVINSSNWIKVEPGSDWEEKLNQTKPALSDHPTTEFLGPFEKAAALFTEGDCTRRSILLFTDGTSEDENGRLTGDALGEEFKQIRSTVQGLAELDGIYVIGFKVNANYLNDEVKTGWSNLVNWFNVEVKLSTSQDEVPRLVFFAPHQFESELEDIRASSKGKIDFKELSEFQNLIVKFDSEPAQLRQGQQRDIQFRLVNGSGNVVMPGGDLAKVLLAGSDPASLPEWKVSVTPVSQEIPLELTQDGDYYRFSWTPESSGVNELQVEYSLVDESGELLSCSGTVSLPVDAIPPVALSLVIGPPLEPHDNAITLPVQLNYDGDSSTLRWGVSASAIETRTGRELQAVPDPNDTTTGKINVIIDPVDDAREIEVNVSAKAQIDGRDITIPKGTTTILIAPPPCYCDGLWNIWFWPLAIVLAGLPIALLVLSFKSERTEVSYQEEKQDKYRSRDWHLLFWPLLALWALLVLNRLLWCCVIPPWLFLVSILILIIILLLVRFVPRGVPDRRRPRWLLFLLLPLALTWYISIGIPSIYLPWVSLILFSAWSFLWYTPPSPHVPMPLNRIDDDRKKDDNNEPPQKDDLRKIEGIEDDVEKLLNDAGIITYKQLAKTDSKVIKGPLGVKRLYMIDPATWPKQAELKDIAQASGKKEDDDVFRAYLAFLKGGRSPESTEK